MINRLPGIAAADPGKTGQDFPTQDITDLTITEEIDCLPQNYSPIAPETPHPDSARAGISPVPILVWQGPSPLQSEPPKIRRVYMTIPGAWVTDTVVDPDGIPVTVRKRKNLNRLIVTSETLSDGIWTHTSNSVGGDAIVGEETVQSRAIPGNPMTVKKTDPDGATVTVKRTLKAQSAITPSESIIAGILTKVSQEDPPVFRGFALRSGDLVAWEVVETRAIPGNVLSNQSIGQPNLTPEKYRRLVRSVETNQTVAPDYSFPSGLTGDQTQVRLQQETIAQARLQTISEVIAIGADPLAGGDTSEWGALSVYESVVNEGTPIETGFLVLNSKVTPFGNGKAVKITVKYSLDIALKHLLTRSLGQDNLTPAKYRRLVQHKETDSLVDPASYSFPSGLSGDQTEVRYIEETIFRARQKTIEEVVAIGADPLLGGETNEFGSLSIGESIVNDGSPIDTGYLVLKSTVTPFGNGKSVKITVSYPVNLALQSILKQSIGQDNLTPAKYRRLVKHVETDSLVDLSTYTFPSGLSGDQTEVKSIQETIARARQTIISEIIAVGADPLAGQETGEWGIESISESIVNDGSAADSGYLVKTSRVTPLGNGKSIKITANYASTLATKQHLGQDLDRKFNIPIPYTDTIIAAGAGIGDASSEITPIDDYRSRKRAVDVSAVTAVFDAYSVVMPGRTRIEFPQVLQTLDFSIEEHTGSGDAATDSVSGSWSGSGSIVIPSHAECQFSRAVMPVLIGVFAPERGSHRYLPTKKVTFLLPAPVTETAVLTRLTAILGVSVTDWPNFNPQEIVAKLVGRQGSARVTADNHFQDGGSSTSSETAHVKSKGHSIDAGLTVKETRIRPSIHGAFTLVTTFTPFSQTITATASIVSDTETSTQTITGIDPSFAIYNVGATTGDTTIPTTGVRLLRTESELYQYGYIMIQAEVLDFADV